MMIEGFSEDDQYEQHNFSLHLGGMARAVIEAVGHFFVIVAAALAAMAAFAGNPKFYTVAVPVAAISASALFTYWSRQRTYS